jgi:hypothetical protein
MYFCVHTRRRMQENEFYLAWMIRHNYTTARASRMIWRVSEWLPGTFFIKPIQKIFQNKFQMLHYYFYCNQPSNNNSEYLCDFVWLNISVLSTCLFLYNEKSHHSALHKKVYHKYNLEKTLIIIHRKNLLLKDDICHPYPHYLSLILLDLFIFILCYHADWINRYTYIYYIINMSVFIDSSSFGLSSPLVSYSHCFSSLLSLFIPNLVINKHYQKLQH